jgi:hypothetical protein
MKLSTFVSGLVMAVLAASSVAQPNTLSARAPNGALITLTQETGPCQAPAKLVHWKLKSDAVDGCWKLEGELVKVSWLDGDSSVIPVQVFKSKPGV